MRTKPTTHNINIAIWPKKWDQVPHTQNISPVNYMKRLIKYYPKTIRSLKPIYLNLTQANPQISNFIIGRQDKKRYYFIGDRWYKLYKTIVDRYRRFFVRHLRFDNNVKNPAICLDTGCLRTLDLDISKQRGLGSIKDNLFKRMLIKSKNVKSLRLTGQQISPPYIVRSLKYFTRLESLELIDLPFLPLEDYQSLLRFQNRLKSLSIIREIAKENELNQDKDYFEKIIRHFLSLPELKRFRFDGIIPGHSNLSHIPFRVSGHFNIGNIPFHLFQKKGVCYDLRVCHSTEEITLTEDNSESLKELDMLGLSFKINWNGSYADPSNYWRFYQDESLKAQKASKNLLFITITKVSMIDLTPLFQPCRNITTLDLILPERELSSINFKGIQDLCNLHSLFLNADNIYKNCERVFENLAVCIQNHKTLKQLHIFLRAKKEDDSKIKALSSFLTACTTTVSKLTVQFGISTWQSIETVIEIFYDILQSFTQLTHLILSFKRISGIYSAKDDFWDKYVQLEKIITALPVLEEFQLFPFSCKSINIDFSKAKKLRKLVLDLSETELTRNILQDYCKLTHLRSLELGFMCSEGDWNSFLKGVLQMKDLEVLKLKLNIIKKTQEGQMDEMEPTRAPEVEDGRKYDIDALMKQKINLKLVAVNKNTRKDKVLVFIRGKYQEDLDGFYGNEKSDRIIYETYYYSQEL